MHVIFKLICLCVYVKQICFLREPVFMRKVVWFLNLCVLLLILELYLYCRQSSQLLKLLLKWNVRCFTLFVVLFYYKTHKKYFAMLFETEQQHNQR